VLIYLLGIYSGNAEVIPGLRSVGGGFDGLLEELLSEFSQ
jgi:hypothetical protein